MKLLWLDLNSSYAHSSLALPALQAQIADDTSIEWDIVSATINENVGLTVNEVYHRQPDILAATTWLFNHEQLLQLKKRLFSGGMRSENFSTRAIPLSLYWPLESR